MKVKCFRELERVERELKSEEELDVDVSEAHPPTVLYKIVPLHLGRDSYSAGS
jgi:hypothetical protein